MTDITPQDVVDFKLKELANERMNECCQRACINTLLDVKNDLVLAERANSENLSSDVVAEPAPAPV